MAQISQRAYQYGVTSEGYGEANAAVVNGRALSAEEQKQRRELIARIRDKGYDQVIEEVAYTWFNRFIALRFMEVNNYLPSRVRVFSDATGAFKPEILSDALHLDLPGLDQAKVAALLEKNQTEDLYRYLLLTQCNALNEPLPKMFEMLGGYTELLLPNNILKQDGILGRMVSDIPEEDWTDQVQIIGWLYQYYNAELKDETFALLKKNVKITKERLPSATQLFTPDWIVRYMVENSLGRLWLEGHPNDALKAEWKYYLDEAEQTPEVQAELEKIRGEYRELKPQDIKFIDPCMGSGHILVYAFDVLVQIYRSVGVSERDAAQSILQNNLYGLDIDERAAQLAYFAVMMKARQYDRRILTRGIQPQVYGPGPDSEVREFGSLLLLDKLPETPQNGQLSFTDESDAYKRLQAQKYHVVVTNPPYMAVSNASAKVQDYVKKHYPDSKSDLFACFIERCGALVEKNGYQAMITQHSWMFLSSFEKLRAKLQMSDTVNMAHLGPRAFEEIGGEVVQTTSFVMRKSHVKNYKGTYCRLIEPTTQQGKEDMFLAGENRYTAQQDNFSKIPGSPVAYWVSEGVYRAFESKRLDELGRPRQGLATGENARFVRLWFEVTIAKIGLTVTSRNIALNSKLKWFPYNKGGEFRKWYGNNDFVVNWENDGWEIRHFTDENNKLRSRPQNTETYFKESITWSKISSGSIAFRYKPIGHIYDVAGTSIFAEHSLLLYLIGFCNSKIALEIASILSPTLNYEVGHVANFPIILDFKWKEKVISLVETTIETSKSDWDSYETSWDFKKHPMV